jgi:hypothetical protein
MKRLFRDREEQSIEPLLTELEGWLLYIHDSWRPSLENDGWCILVGIGNALFVMRRMKQEIEAKKR